MHTVKITTLITHFRSFASSVLLTVVCLIRECSVLVVEIVLNVAEADERSINSQLFKEVPKRKGGLIMNCICKFPPIYNLGIESSTILFTLSLR